MWCIPRWNPMRQDYRHRDSAKGSHHCPSAFARTTARLFEETCSRAVLCLDPEPFVRPVRVAVALRDDSLETEPHGGVEQRLAVVEPLNGLHVRATDLERLKQVAPVAVRK